MGHLEQAWRSVSALYSSRVCTIYEDPPCLGPDELPKTEQWPRVKLWTAGAEVDAAEFAFSRLGFLRDAKQAEVMLSNSKRRILNCSRPLVEIESDGGADRHRVNVKATECEGIPRGFLDWERRTMTATWFVRIFVRLSLR